MRISDSIEGFIKTLLSQEEAGVELRRNELAEYFGCAPSQINYVLSTRFTVDDGYMVESRRGGGGYIRIVQVVQQEEDPLLQAVRGRIGGAINEGEAVRLLGQLVQRGALTPEDAGLIRAGISGQALAVPVPEGVKDTLRARTLKCMLNEIIRRGRQGLPACQAE